MTEEEIVISFRCFRGGMPMLGVKSAWWVQHMDQEINEEEIGVNVWQPTKDQITLAEKFLFDIFQKLDEYDRRIIICRCGYGFKKSYRKCGREMNLHHEVFRQEFQSVIKKVKKLFDEML